MAYSYKTDQPVWENDYLWRPLMKIMNRVAPPPRKLFELGCGNGASARMLAGEGYSVTAVDPSVSGISFAKAYESDNLRFEVASTADDLANRFGTFPVVMSIEVIEHCASAREFMSAFHSLIAPGGLGILSTPYHGYLKNLALVASGNFDRHFDPLWEGGHLKFFTISKLRALFDEFGFTSYQFHKVGRIPLLEKSVIAVVKR